MGNADLPMEEQVPRRCTSGRPSVKCAREDLIEVSPPDAERSLWLEARRHGLGGTDVAALIGIHPYQTALGVYLEKVHAKGWQGTQDRPDAVPGDMSDARYWGTVLEGPVAEHFARRNGLEVRRAGTWARGGWQLASPDRLIGSWSSNETATPMTADAVYEGKTASAWLHKEWQAAKVPDHYVVQIQWYLHVLGLRQAHVAALIGGQQYVQAEITRDDELVDGLVTLAARFWSDHVQARRPPSLKGESASAAMRLLRSMHPVSVDGSRVNLDQEFAKVLGSWEFEKEQVRIHKKRADDLQVLVREAVGDAEVAYIGDRPVCRAINVPGGPVAFQRKPSRRFSVIKDGFA